MPQLKTAALLLTSCLALSACEPKRVVTALPIPPERMDCQDATGQRPKLSPEFVIDWSKIATVDEAHAAFDNFTLVLRGREQTVANYVIELEGKLFQCANDAAWLREREAEIAR